MKQKRVQKFVSILALFALTQIIGCAGTETDDDNRRQGPPSMGQNGHGGKQGQPPMNEDNRGGADNDANREITAEAIDVCAGKKPGDFVEFTDPKGKKIKAICQEYNDHLVAFPEEKRKKNNKTRP